MSWADSDKKAAYYLRRRQAARAAPDDLSDLKDLKPDRDQLNLEAYANDRRGHSGGYVHRGRLF